MQPSWDYDPKQDLYVVVVRNTQGEIVQTINLEPNDINRQLALDMSSVFLQIAQDMQEVFAPELESTIAL